MIKLETDVKITLLQLAIDANKPAMINQTAKAEDVLATYKQFVEAISEEKE